MMFVPSYLNYWRSDVSGSRLPAPGYKYTRFYYVHVHCHNKKTPITTGLQIKDQLGGLQSLSSHLKGSQKHEHIP